MSDEQSQQPIQQKDAAGTTTRGAMIISAAVALSRVLGLAREMVFSTLFGASAVMSAFVVGFRIPNLLRDLFAEGALSTAFVTVFSKQTEKHGQEAAWALANKMRSMVAVCMGLIVMLGVIFAPVLVSLLAPDWEGDQRQMTILLTRIMFPFIGLVSMAALVMGMLNACKAFTMPALASCFFNLGSILGGVTLAWLIDPSFGPISIVGMALGTLIGGFLQLAIQLPMTHKLGYRPRMDFHWRDSGVAHVLRLMGPAILASSAVQVNVMVNTIFATYVSEQAPALLNYAFRLMQLPLGMFGVAIATVTLPLVSRSAANENFEEFRDILARGIRFALFLAVPSALGLIVLGEPIVSLIYERGEFTAADVPETAAALSFYALGLLGYSALKVVTPTFYALEHRFIPMIVGLISIGVNAGLNYYFIFELKLGVVGLALSTSLLAMINFLVLYFWMGGILKGLESGKLLAGLAKLAVAGAALAAAAWLGDYYLIEPFWETNLLIRILVLLTTVGVSAGLFFLVAYLLHMDEVHQVVKLVKRKLNKVKK